METKKVLLGSSSKFRKKLCANALPEGFQLLETTISPDIDEKAIRREDPKEMVIAISEAKTDRAISLIEASESLKCENSPDILICGDQVIVFKDEVREKPENEAKAKQQLQSYGKENVPAVCISGIVVTNLKTGKRLSAVGVAKVFWKEIPDNVALAVIEKKDIMYCAGSFVVEEELLQPFLEKVEGEIECVQGMPLALTKKLVLEAVEPGM